MESEKKECITWALKLCQTMFKDKENTLKVIVTGLNTALTNFVAKVFPTSYALLCRYHIRKNVISRVKPAVGTKKINGEDGKMVKVGVIMEIIIDVWNVIINSSMEELYVDVVILFRKVCEKYSDLLKYVESTILDQVKEKIICAWADHVRHLGNAITN